MYLDPLAITINVQHDNNSLQVPSICPMDGTIVIAKQRHYSDSNAEEGRHHRNTIPSPSPSVQSERLCMKRPVSEQNINMNKTRKEKAVSWYNKFPTSTQTLGCVEGVSDEKPLENDIPNTQSQPLLGTLESNSAKKHICRHTYSVRHVKSPKDGKRAWNLRRCVSSGSDKTRFREKYLQLRPTNKIEDCSSPLTIANEAKLARQLNSSRQSSLDQARSDEMSLIDWEEDEKLCDEEVGHITGQYDKEEDDVRPTAPSVAVTDSEISVFLADEVERDNRSNVGETSAHIDTTTDHSTRCSRLYPREELCNDASPKCDQSGLTYALPHRTTISQTKSTIKVPNSVDLKADPQSALTVPPLDNHAFKNCLLDIPHEPTCSGNTSKSLLGENALFVKFVPLDEGRPPLPNPHTG